MTHLSQISNSYRFIHIPLSLTDQHSSPGYFQAGVDVLFQRRTQSTKRDNSRTSPCGSACVGLPLIKINP